jgi:flagellar biosynthesis/type III secretory pathway protein FliH
MDWFEVCMQHLWKLTIEADVDRSLMVKKHEEAVATVRAKCEEEVQRAQRKLLAPTLHMIEEKEKKADTALAAIAKRETELATAEAGLEQLKEQSKTYQNLCESIHNLGVKNTDALRELKSIASGKAMLEGSVKKWETLHCGTDLRDIIAKVNKRQRIEEDMKRTEQNDLTIAAHKLESELDELASRKATELAKAMDERKTAIRERQELKAKHLKWLAQRGRELNDTTSRAASQAWCDDEIDKLRPVMLAEAERCVATSMKKTWEEEKNHALSMAKEEGRQAGYTYGMQDGHAQGKREGFRLGKEATLEEAYTRVARLEDEIDTRGYDRGYDIGHDIGEATGYAQGYEEGKETGHATGHAEGLVEGESTGYNAGFADGLEEGRQKAVKKFKKKEHISRKENQYIGFHKAMLVVVSEKHKEPLLPQKSKSPAAPYLWGKKVAKFVDDNAM